MATDSFDDLYQKAMRYYSQGKDDQYIYFQLSEEGIEPRKIDEVLTAIKKFRKKAKRSDGVRSLVIGLSIIAIGMGLVWFINQSQGSYIVIAWGLPIFGLIIVAKGLMQIIGL